MERNESDPIESKSAHEQDKIRNISIIAHVDHGKTTFINSLLSGLRRGEDAKRDPETTTCDTTCASNFVPLHVKHNEHSYALNMINCPVSSKPEFSAALRVTDGAIIVVDCIEGVWVHDTVIHQAISERVRPLLHVNKLDRCINELQLPLEETYHMLDRQVQIVNTIINYNCEDEALRNSFELDPRKGNVSFGSGKQGWAFTLPQFARMLAKRANNMDPDKILHKLWGDHYYDPDTKTFTKQALLKSGKPLERFFCVAVLSPIFQIFNAINERKTAELENILTKLNIELSVTEKSYTGNNLVTCVMQKFLFGADALSEMITTRLASPQESQRYRAEVLYTGQVMKDEINSAISECNPNGPAIMFVRKLIPTEDTNGFYAFGRVLSGTLRANSTVLVVSTEYHTLKEIDYAFVTSIRVDTLATMTVRSVTMMDSLQSRNVVTVLGVAGERYCEVILSDRNTLE